MRTHRPPAALLALVLAVSPASRTAAQDAGRPLPPDPRGQVMLPSGHVLMVEVADTPYEIARGYMFRERINDDEGMVFLFDAPGFHDFWMKNCKVALDITWLDVGWNVVHQALNVPPCRQDPCPTYRPLRASKYVLEVRAGLARREGLEYGTSITYLPPADAARSPGPE